MSQSSGPEPRPSTSGQPAAARILVVDDDDYVHVALRAALRPIRASIERAAGAAEGLALARAQLPDLAIIDLGLPDADGYELTRWLRAEPGMEQLRILIVTGHFPDTEAALAAGADEIMGKPFKLHDFLEAVRRQLRNRALAS